MHPLRPLAVLLAPLVLAACDPSADPAATPVAGDTMTVVRGDLPRSLHVVADVQAVKNHTLQHDLPLEATIAELADEGARVAKGDVVVRLDDTELKRVVTQRIAEAEAAAFELALAELRLAIRQAQAEVDVPKAAAAIIAAEQALARYVEGDFPQTFRERRLAVDRSGSELTRAQRRLADLEQLLAEQLVSAANVKDARIDVKAKMVAKESAAQQMFVLERFEYPLARRRKINAVTQARNDHRNTTARSRANLSEVTESLANAKEHFADRVRLFREANAALGMTTLTAPVAGLVIYGGPDWGRRQWRLRREIKVGGRFKPQQTFITIPQLDQAVAVGWVNEVDVLQLRTAQRARVTFPAFPGERFQGRVVRIASVGQREEDVRRFEVRVLLDARPQRLFFGMTAYVKIDLAPITNVLQVPLSAVRAEGTHYFVELVTPAGRVSREVQLGAVGVHAVEIRNGLQAGDTIVRSERRP